MSDLRLCRSFDWSERSPVAWSLLSSAGVCTGRSLCGGYRCGQRAHAGTDQRWPCVGLGLQYRGSAGHRSHRNGQGATAGVCTQLSQHQTGKSAISLLITPGSGSQLPFLLQISAGRTHSAAWTAPRPLPSQPGMASPQCLGIPAAIPAEFTALKDCSVEAIRGRLMELHRFSDLIYSSWRLIDLSPLSETQVRSFSPSPLS